MGYDFHHAARVARRATALIGPDGGNRRAGQEDLAKMSGLGQGQAVR